MLFFLYFSLYLSSLFLPTVFLGLSEEWGRYPCLKHYKIPHPVTPIFQDMSILSSQCRTPFLKFFTFTKTVWNHYINTLYKILHRCNTPHCRSLSTTPYVLSLSRFILLLWYLLHLIHSYRILSRTLAHTLSHFMPSFSFCHSSHTLNSTSSHTAVLLYPSSTPLLLHH